MPSEICIIIKYLPQSVTPTVIFTIIIITDNGSNLNEPVYTLILETLYSSNLHHHHHYHHHHHHHHPHLHHHHRHHHHHHRHHHHLPHHHHYHYYRCDHHFSIITIIIVIIIVIIDYIILQFHHSDDVHILGEAGVRWLVTWIAVTASLYSHQHSIVKYTYYSDMMGILLFNFHISPPGSNYIIQITYDLAQWSYDTIETVKLNRVQFTHLMVHGHVHARLPGMSSRPGIL